MFNTPSLGPRYEMKAPGVPLTLLGTSSVSSPGCRPPAPGQPQCAAARAGSGRALERARSGAAAAAGVTASSSTPSTPHLTREHCPPSLLATALHVIRKLRVYGERSERLRTPSSRSLVDSAACGRDQSCCGFSSERLWEPFHSALRFKGRETDLQGPVSELRGKF